jgi:hypothetical protein
MRRPVFLVLLAGCGGAALGTRPSVLPVSLPPGEVSATGDARRMVGWGEGEVTVAATATWRPDPDGVRIQATVLVRAEGDQRDVLLVLSTGDRLIAKVPLTTCDGRAQTLTASLSELPLGTVERVLRVDVRKFEDGGLARFAVKCILVGGRGQKLLDRLVESGDRVRDRRASLVAATDGSLRVEERESGDPARHELVYHRGADGTFVTEARSIFDD